MLAISASAIDAEGMSKALHLQNAQFKESSLLAKQLPCWCAAAFPWRIQTMQISLDDIEQCLTHTLNIFNAETLLIHKGPCACSGADAIFGTWHNKWD